MLVHYGESSHTNTLSTDRHTDGRIEYLHFFKTIKSNGDSFCVFLPHDKNRWAY